MYIIYDAKTKEYINIVKELPEAMVPGRAYKEVADDFDWVNSYIDENDVLHTKETLSYTITGGVVVFQYTVVDVLNIDIIEETEDEFGLYTENLIASLTLDLAQNNTIDLSAYVGYKAKIYGKKYKLSIVNIA